MKKSYAKPLIEIESYELSASIAQGCTTPINLGPEAAGYETCDSFKDSFEMFAFIPGLGIQSTANGTPFYEDGSAKCNCYYSSGDGLYFMS